MARSAIAKVNWYGDKVSLLMKDAKKDLVKQIAFQVEAQAKVNIVSNNQVDTGFMLNSTYTVTQDGDSYAGAVVKAKSAAPRDLAPKAGLGDADAAVCCGAEYAIFQEARRSFLYAAAESAARDMGAIVEKVARKIKE